MCSEVVSRQESVRPIAGDPVLHPGTFQAGSKHYADLKACETLNFLGDQWEALGDMTHARCNFNPCDLYDTLYLCGGGTDLIEIFDPKNNNFNPLPVHLPEKTPCSVFVENGKLVVLSGNFVSKWRVDHGQLREEQRQEHPGCSVIANMAPVLKGEHVYLSWWGDCYRAAVDGSRSDVIGSEVEDSWSLF